MTELWFVENKLSVRCETELPAETVYVLWRAIKHGAQVSIPCRFHEVTVMVNLASLNPELTFSRIIIGNFGDSIPPPPP